MKHFAFAFELLNSAKPGEPPSEFRIFSAGLNRTKKGDFLFDAEAAKRVMAAAKDWGNDHPIDYDHAMLNFFAVDPAESGKSAGTFGLDLREGALYAVNVQWTPPAAQKLTNREYRYTSPAFVTEKLDDGSRRISELVNVAITNLPATKNMSPLMASWLADDGAPSEEKPKMKTLLVALGLAESASEAEALASLSKLTDLAKQLMVLTGKAAFSEALGVVQAWKLSADQVAVLSTKLSEIEKASAAREVDELITAAKRDGKLAPAMESFARELASKDVKSLKAFLDAMPKLVQTRASGGQGEDVEQLSGIELEILKKTGTDPKAFAKSRAELVAKGHIVGA